MSALQLLQPSAVVCGSIITACAWMVQWQSGQVKLFGRGGGVVNGIFLETSRGLIFNSGMDHFGLRGEYFFD